MPISPSPSQTPTKAVTDGPPPNARLGKYRVLRRLGKGGMGVVVEAEDTILGRRVALKVLPEEVASDGPSVERFFLECRAAATLQHPNVVTVYEADRAADGTVFMAMELVAGGSVENRIRHRQPPLPLEQALTWTIEVASGLEAAHAAGLIHRDIKPANILLSDTGTAKLADFGLVKRLDALSGITAEGSILGTPHYMSPEQCQNAPVDARSDVYSLGATLYAILTGETPFGSRPPLQVMFAHTSAVRPNPRTLRPEVPDELSATIAKAMSVDPAQRYPSAAAFREALEELLVSGAVPSGALPSGAGPSGFRPSASRRALPASLAPRSVPAPADPSGVSTAQTVMAIRASSSPPWLGLALGGAIAATLIIGLLMVLVSDGSSSADRDAAARDAAARDASTKDSAARDAGTKDSAARDASTKDSAARDAGTKDARPAVKVTVEVPLPPDGPPPLPMPPPKKLLPDPKAALSDIKKAIRPDDPRDPKKALLDLKKRLAMPAPPMPGKADPDFGVANPRLQNDGEGEFIRPRDQPTSVGLAADQTLLWGASTYDNEAGKSRGEVVIHHLPSGRERVLWQGNREVSSVVFSPDGQRIAAAQGSDVMAWDRSGRELLKRTKANGNFRNVVFAPDGESLVASFESWTRGEESRATLTRWRPSGQQEPPAAEVVQDGRTQRLAYSPDGRWLVTGSRAGVFVLRDPATLAERHRLPADGDEVYAAGFAPLTLQNSHGISLATAFKKNHVRVWDLSQPEPKLLGELPPSHTHSGWVTAAIFAPDGRRLLTVSGEEICIWWIPAEGDRSAREPSQWELIKSWQPHGGNTVWQAVLSADGQVLATAGGDHTLRIWSVAE